MATKLKAVSKKTRPVQKKTTKVTPRRKVVTQKTTVTEAPSDRIEDLGSLVNTIVDNIRLQKMENEVYVMNIRRKIEEDIVKKEASLRSAEDTMLTLKDAYEKTKEECFKMEEDLAKLNDMITSLACNV